MGIDRDMLNALSHRQRLRHHDLNEGLDTSIVYLTLKRLAQMAGLSRATLCQDMNKGRLTPARRSAGTNGVLIHPEEARRYLLAPRPGRGRKAKEKVPC